MHANSGDQGRSLPFTTTASLWKYSEVPFPRFSTSFAVAVDGASGLCCWGPDGSVPSDARRVAVASGEPNGVAMVKSTLGYLTLWYVFRTRNLTKMAHCCCEGGYRDPRRPDLRWCWELATRGHND